MAQLLLVKLFSLSIIISLAHADCFWGRKHHVGERFTVGGYWYKCEASPYDPDSRAQQPDLIVMIGCTYNGQTFGDGDVIRTDSFVFECDVIEGDSGDGQRAEYKVQACIDSQGREHAAGSGKFTDECHDGYCVEKECRQDGVHLTGCYHSASSQSIHRGCYIEESDGDAVGCVGGPNGGVQVRVYGENEKHDIHSDRLHRC